MRKTSFTVVRIGSLLLLSGVVLFSAGCKKEKSKKIVTMQDAFATEFEMRHCQVSPEEAKKAYAYWMEHDESVKTRLKKNEENKIVIAAALRQIVEKKADPAVVYEENKLYDCGIHADEWDSIVKEFNTVDKIKILESRMPENNKELTDEKTTEFFRRILEQWLLREYIICVFDSMNPQLRDMEKTNKIEALRGMDFRVLGLSFSQTAVWNNVVMNDFPEYDFSEFFAERLKKFPDYVKSDFRR